MLIQDKNLRGSREENKIHDIPLVAAAQAVEEERKEEEPFEEELLVADSDSQSFSVDSASSKKFLSSVREHSLESDSWHMQSVRLQEQARNVQSFGQKSPSEQSDEVEANDINILALKVMRQVGKDAPGMLSSRGLNGNQQVYLDGDAKDQTPIVR